MHIKKEQGSIAIRDFGQMHDDRCLVAEVGDKIVGAIWSRIMNDYGHIADDVEEAIMKCVL